MRKLFCAGQMALLLLIPISFINAQDNVGIGTTTPDPGAILELVAPDKGFLMTRLNSTDTTIPALNVEGMMYYAQDINMIMYYDGGSWLTLSTGVNYWGENGGDIFNLNGGWVGIGTSTPFANLHVNGDVNGGFVYTQIENTNSNGEVSLDLVTDLGRMEWRYQGSLLSDPTLYLWDSRAGQTRFIVDTAGQVGIGGFLPEAQFDVTGNVPSASVAAEIENTSSIGWTSLDFAADVAYWSVGVDGSAAGFGTDNDFWIIDNAAGVRMVIDETGSVGIGTTTPLGNLHVENTDWNSNAVYLNSTATSAGSTIRFANPQTGNHTYDIIGSTGSGAATGVGAFGIWDNTDGAYRLVIQSSGSVGIGGTGAVNALDVNGSSVIGSGYFGTVAPSNGLLVEGNVGIGLTNPAYALHVSGTGNKYIELESTNAWVLLNMDKGSSTASSYLSYRTLGSERWLLGDYSTGGAENFRLVDWTNGGGSNYTMYIERGGINSIGLGTNTPVNKLDVEGAVAIGATYSGTSTAPTNGAIIEGSTGIGVSSLNSAYKLHVNTGFGSTQRYAGLFQSDYDGASQSYGLFSWMTGAGSGTHYGLYISNGSATTGTQYGVYSTGEDYNYFSGKVGIGVAIPSTVGILHVAGGDVAIDANSDNGIRWVTGNTIEAHLFRWSSNDNLYVTNNGSANLTGVYLSDGATSWTSTSDRRLKENIVETSYGLKDILQLSAKEYNYRTTSERDKEIGLIAQEVYEVIPEIVQKGDDGPYRGSGNTELSQEAGFKPWGIEYSALIPVLIKSVQELKAENDKLRERIKALEDK